MSTMYEGKLNPSGNTLTRSGNSTINAFKSIHEHIPNAMMRTYIGIEMLLSFSRRFAISSKS